MVRAFGGTDPATRASPAAPGAGVLPNSTASLRLKIPEWLPSTSQVTRLQVACRPLWPRKSRDSGDCGEQAAGRGQNGEIRGKRAAKGKAGGRRMSEESTPQPPLAGAKVLRICCGRRSGWLAGQALLGVEQPITKELVG